MCNMIFEMKCVGEMMMNWIDLFAKEKGIDLIKYVSVSELSEHENRGLPNAILLVKILPKDYIGKLARAKKADCSVFTQTEHFTDEIADLLAEEIRKKAYQAISQSENSLLNRGDFLPEIKTSILPHSQYSIGENGCQPYLESGGLEKIICWSLRSMVVHFLCVPC